MSFDPSAFLASRFGGPPAAAPASGDVLSRMVPITRYSESRGNPNAVSPKGARGTMQVMPSTAARPGYGIKPSNGTPDDDARVGSEKLAAMMSRYGNDPAKAWAAYNWGEDKLDKAIAAQGSNWLSVAPKETKDYVSNNLAMLSGKVPVPASGSSFDPTAFLGKRFQAPPAAQQQAAQGEPDVISAYMGDKEAAPGADTPYAKQFRTGLQAAFRAKGATPETVQAFLDPYGVKYADLKVGGNPFGNAATLVVPDKVVPQAVPEHTAADALSAGFKQGAQHDVGGTLDKFASWADSKVPVLNAIDRLASGVNPALDPNAITARAGAYDNQRGAFDANYGDNGWASTGRIGGQLVTSAPLLAAGGEALPMALEGAAGIEGAPEVLQTGANFLRGTAGAPTYQGGEMLSAGNPLTRLASRVVAGANQGAQAGAITAGASDDPVGNQILRGAEMGGLVGAAAGPANALWRAASPSVDRGTAQLAQKAADMGIHVRGSQISSSPFVRTVDSVLARVPGSGIAADNAAQRSAFTRAVGSTFGADADQLTPQVMQAARENIGKTYDDVASRTTLNVHPEQSSFVDNLAGIQNDARGYLGTDKAPALDRLIDNILDKVKPDGTIDGKTFKALTAKGSMLDSATKAADPSFASAAKAVKGELNNALSASAAPEDVAALKNADWQWKNMKTVERLVANSPDGTISPALLQRPVTSSFTNRAYTGAGDLGDLGDIGQRFLKDQGSSNTAERSQLFNFLVNAAKVGGGAGATVLGMKAGVSAPEILLGAGAGASGLGLGRITGAALRSDLYRNRLINAALNGGDTASGTVGKYLLPPAVMTTNRLMQSSSPGREK